MADLRRPIWISAGLHFGVIALAMVTLPSPRPNFDASTIESIPLDLVEISDEPQATGEKDAKKAPVQQRRTVTNPAPTPQPAPIEEATKPVDPSSAPTPPPPPAPPERKAEAKPEVKPDPKPVAEPLDPDALLKKLEEVRKKEEEKKQEEARKKEEEKKKEEARKKEEQKKIEEAKRKEEQRQAQIKRDILNHQKGTVRQTGVQGNEQREAALGNPQGTGRRLNQSQYAQLVGMIRDQIQPCWSPPPSAADRPVVVKIELKMNRDGTLNGRPSVTNSSNDPSFRLMADSATRAILRCAAQNGGLKLPADMYDAPNGWREIEFAFDPSQLL